MFASAVNLPCHSVSSGSCHRSVNAYSKFVWETVLQFPFSFISWLWRGFWFCTFSLTVRLCGSICFQDGNGIFPCQYWEPQTLEHFLVCCGGILCICTASSFSSDGGFSRWHGRVSANTTPYRAGPSLVCQLLRTYTMVLQELILIEQCTTDDCAIHWGCVILCTLRFA